MARPTSSGDQSDMANEEDLARYLNSPSPPPSFPPLSNSMVVYYQGSGQSSMDNPLENRQQRPTNSGDQSDRATEDFDVMIFLDFPPSPPSPSPSSASNSMLVYQQGSGQSSMDFVDRPLYIAGDWALSRQKLLQFWMDASDVLGPRGGIMSINKENRPQNLECLGINLLYLYVEDEFDTLLYWPGESSWKRLRAYLEFALKRLLQGQELARVYACMDLERKDYGQGIFATKRITIGVCRIGPREWVAKICHRRHSLESPLYVDKWGQYRYSLRMSRVLLEDAQLDFPDLFQDSLHALVVETAQLMDNLRLDDPQNLRVDDPDTPLIHYLYVKGCCRLNYSLAAPYEDFFDVEPVRIKNDTYTPCEPLPATPSVDHNPCERGCDWKRHTVRIVGERIVGDRTEEAEIAESQLNPGPSRKKQRKEKTPTGERGNKKTTRVQNVITLEKILQVKEMSLKSAAELLKVSPFALTRACREHGIKRWPPHDIHKTPNVVDEEELAQLTSDTLRSNQTFTNSVAEETTPQQFSPTVRQEKPDYDSGNDEVEKVGMGGVGTGEGGMPRNEMAPRGERGGVRIKISLEEILKYSHMHIEDAARELKVSKSTLKRICRDYNISRWPPRDEHKCIGQSHPNESPAIVDQERIPTLKSNKLLPGNQVSATIDNTHSVTVRANYQDLRIKFQLSLPWRMLELEQEVKKRLQLEAGTYYIKYKDEDDGLTLIACDEDLKDCISSSSPLGTHSIEVLLSQKVAHEVRVDQL